MADQPRPGSAAETRPLPLAATMGLLNYITAHSMDEDYALASHRRQESRAEAGEPAKGRRAGRASRAGGPSLVVLLVFGLLVTTAAAETARNEPAQRTSQESLVAQIEDRREQLARAREQIGVLEDEVALAQESTLENSSAGRALGDRLDTLALLSGAAAATGPGVQIRVDDAPGGDERQVVLDTDLQILANGLWAAGAEAMSINGQRLTALTAIRVAGEAITVNLRSLSRPYIVTALGDPDQLAARFLDSSAGSWWLNLRSLYDLEFAMTTEDSLTVPAASDLDLRHAQRLRGES